MGRFFLNEDLIYKTTIFSYLFSDAYGNADLGWAFLSSPILLLGLLHADNSNLYQPVLLGQRNLVFSFAPGWYGESYFSLSVPGLPFFYILHNLESGEKCEKRVNKSRILHAVFVDKWHFYAKNLC